MDCMICDQECKRRSKIFADGKKLFVCWQCVLRLRTHELYFCETCGKYHLNRKRRLKDTKDSCPEDPALVSL